jgi:transcriptional regulator with XRE-family HTH domain
MQTQEVRIQERNREIGRILQEARSLKNITVTICAQLIGTSRRRYAAMERGEAMIGIAELEVLMDFLNIPSHKIWQIVSGEGSTDRLFVPFTPGKPVQIVFDVRT